MQLKHYVCFMIILATCSTEGSDRLVIVTFLYYRPATLPLLSYVCLTLGGRPVSCKPSSLTLFDGHTPAAPIRKWQKAAGEPGIPVVRLWCIL